MYKQWPSLCHHSEIIINHLENLKGPGLHQIRSSTSKNVQRWNAFLDESDWSIFKPQTYKNVIFCEFNNVLVVFVQIIEVLV